MITREETEAGLSFSCQVQLAIAIKQRLPSSNRNEGPILLITRNERIGLDSVPPFGIISTLKKNTEESKRWI